MRFKLDENLPLQLQRLFVESGHDAATVLNEGIGGATDTAVASVCLAENRVLVTQDLGFADIRTYPPRRYPGIVVFRLTSQTRNALLAGCGMLMDVLASSDLKGRLWIVEHSRVRIRE